MTKSESNLGHFATDNIDLLSLINSRYSTMACSFPYLAEKQWLGLEPPTLLTERCEAEDELEPAWV